MDSVYPGSKTGLAVYLREEERDKEEVAQGGAVGSQPAALQC